MSIWNKCDMCGKELGKSALIYRECGHIICGRHTAYADLEAPCPRCATQHSVQRTAERSAEAVKRGEMEAAVKEHEAAPSKLRQVYDALHHLEARKNTKRLSHRR